MILYFSGNGNTKYVAQQISIATNDTIENMNDYINGKKDIANLEIGDKLGIFFPTHAWYAPQPVLDLIKKIIIPQHTYVYAVSTCGDNIGMGMHRFAKHIHIDAGWTVIMPETYIVFPLDSDENAIIKINKATKRCADIAQHVNNKDTGIMDVTKGLFPYSLTYFVNHFFVKWLVDPKRFFVEDGCTSCSSCVNACPLNNLSLNKSGTPVWGKNCITCMACVNICPKQVIQFGKVSKKRGRYNIKKLLSEIKGHNQ